MFTETIKPLMNKLEHHQWGVTFGLLLAIILITISWYLWQMYVSYHRTGTCIWKHELHQKWTHRSDWVTM